MLSTSYIVFIGTKYDQPPSNSNSEYFVVLEVNENLNLGYISVDNIIKYVNKYDIARDFYARAGFVFPDRPYLNKIKNIYDNLEEELPYFEIYDMIVSDKHNMYATYYKKLKYNK